MATPDVPGIEHESTRNHSQTWMRGLFMLIFFILFGMGQSLLFMTAVVQFFWLLFAGAPNALLVRFGSSLALWLAATARFLCLASEEKPFPWTEWPRAS
jgi:hypothetical protein